MQYRWMVCPRSYSFGLVSSEFWPVAPSQTAYSRSWLVVLKFVEFGQK
ncbi:MAG TPA: hypothetical protein VND92_09935 [Vicinamibacterales bacterium]|nr:hypothetical protein [Vicinamibacterales bacterium]